MSIPDGLTAATSIAVAVIGAASAWGVSVWVNARHRSWKSLSDDLDLADKIDKMLPEHADWLRRSVALRLKGQAMKDSRIRRDVRQSMWGGVYLLTGMLLIAPGALLLVGGINLFVNALGVAVFLVGGALSMYGVYEFIGGAAGKYRVPGLSAVDMYGTKDERKRMGAELVDLHQAACALPNSIDVTTHKLTVIRKVRRKSD